MNSHKQAFREVVPPEGGRCLSYQIPVTVSFPGEYARNQHFGLAVPVGRGDPSKVYGFWQVIHVNFGKSSNKYQYITWGKSQGLRPATSHVLRVLSEHYPNLACDLPPNTSSIVSLCVVSFESHPEGIAGSWQFESDIKLERTYIGGSITIHRKFSDEWNENHWFAYVKEEQVKKRWPCPPLSIITYLSRLKTRLKRYLLPHRVSI